MTWRTFTDLKSKSLSPNERDIVDSTHMEFVSAKAKGAFADGTRDDTGNLIQWLNEFLTRGGTSKKLILPQQNRGTKGYMVRGGHLLIENFNSGIIEGHGQGFTSTIRLQSGETGPALKLGGQTAAATEPFDSLVSSISLDGGGNDLTSGLLQIGKMQRSLFYNVGVRNWDSGAGIVSLLFVGTNLFNNMQFAQCFVIGNGKTTSDHCYDLYVARSVLFSGGSAENASTAVRLRPTATTRSGACQAYFAGFHIERSDIAIDALDTSISGKIENLNGSYTLRQGCVGCEILGSGALGSGETTPVLDANFGNKYSIPGGLSPSGGGSVVQPGLSFDGKEFLRTLNAVHDPTFRDISLANWTTSNATIVSKALTLPNASGRSIAITSSAADGYAETDIYPDESVDYLLMAGFAVDLQADASVRIEVIDTSGPTDLWDSGVIDYTGQVAGNNTIWRFVYKRIPVGSDVAAGVNPLKIRLYSVVSGTTVYCPLLLFMKSAWNMETSFSGADASLIGSGVGAQIQNVSVSNTEVKWQDFGDNRRHVEGGIFHVKIDSHDDQHLLGYGGDTNTTTAGPIALSRQFDIGDEFNFLSSTYPKDSLMRFRAFSGGDITVSEAALIRIGDSEWGLISYTEETALAATTTRRVGVAPMECNLIEDTVRLVTAATIGASGANYWTVEVFRRRGSTEALMATGDSQSGWTADTSITIPIQARSVEPDDIIKVVYTRTGTPTNLEPNISMKFGWDAA